MKIINFTGVTGAQNLTNLDPEVQNAKSKGWDIIPEPKGMIILKQGSILNTIWDKSMTRFIKSDTIPANVITTSIANDNSNHAVTWYDTATSTQYWYADDVAYLNEDCSSMFSGIPSVTNIDLEGIDIANSSITNMKEMFYNCASLTSIDTSFNTSKVTNMFKIFYGCKSLTTLDLSSWDTSMVTTMKLLFYGCTKLTTLNISSFDTSNVTDMSEMFYSCDALTSLDLSNFNTLKVTDMSYMFYYCTELVSIITSDTFNTSAVTNMNMMVSYCGKLTTFKINNIATNIDLSGCPLLSMDSLLYMMSNAKTVIGKTLNITGCIGYDTLRPTDIEVVNILSKGWTIIPEVKQVVVLITGPNFNTLAKTLSTNTNQITQFARSTSIPDAITTSPISTDGISAVMWYDATNTSLYWYATSDKVYLNEDCSKMFSGFGSVTNLDMSMFDTHNTINMYDMFAYCYALSSLNLSTFNTSNVTNMGSMFYRCRLLSSLNISKFNTIKVTNMNSMFTECVSLSTLDLSSFNTTNVTDMGSMFTGCSLLASINFNFDTVNVDNMDNMFQNCIALTGPLDLSGWNISNVVSMNYIFEGCSSLSDLNVSEWVFTNTYYAVSLFAECSSLVNLNISNWGGFNENIKLESIFDLCTSIVSLDLSTWDLTGVADIRLMFADCTSLESIDLSCDLSSIYYMTNTFYNCKALSNLKLKGIKNVTVDLSKCPNITAESIRYIFTNANTITDGYVYKINITGCIGYNDLLPTDPEVINILSKGWTIVPEIAAPDNSSIEFTYKTGTAPADTTGYTITGTGFTLDKSQADKLILKSVKNVTDIIYPDDVNIIGVDIKDAENLAGIKYDKIDSEVNQQGALNRFSISGINKIDNMSYYTFSNCNSPIIIGDFSLPNATSLKEAFIGQNISFEKETPIIVLDSVIDVRSMFEGAYFTNSISAPIFNLSLPKAKDIGRMFKNAGTYSVSKFDAPEALSTTSIEGIYYSGYCFAESGLTSISGINLPKFASLEGMVAYCTSLVSVEIIPGGTVSATDMNNMFMADESLTTVNGLIVSANVTNTSFMFTLCKEMISLDISNWDTRNVTTMEEMFSQCDKITSIDGIINMSNVTNADLVFAIAETKIVNLNIIGVNIRLDLSSIILSAESIHNILTNIGTPTETGSSILFHRSSESLITIEDRTSALSKGWYIYPGGVKEVTTLKSGKIFSEYSGSPITAFKRSMILPDENIIPSDISEYEDFSVITWYNSTDKTQYWYSDSSTIYMNPYSKNMFYYLDSLTILELSGFDTSKVTNMNQMFKNCKILSKLDLSTFDTSKVIDMGNMFENCAKLTTITYGSNFIKNATLNETGMFLNCPANKPW